MNQTLLKSKGREDLIVPGKILLLILIEYGVANTNSLLSLVCVLTFIFL